MIRTTKLSTVIFPLQRKDFYEFVIHIVCVIVCLFRVSFNSIRSIFLRLLGPSSWAVSILHFRSTIYCSRSTENSITRS